MNETGKFEMHCMVELFGHQKIAGKVTEQVIAGSGFIRVDVPKTSKRDGFTRLYGPSAIYAMTPVSEQIAQIMAERLEVEAVSEWQLSQALKNLLPASVAIEDGDEDNWPSRFDDEGYSGDPVEEWHQEVDDADEDVIAAELVEAESDPILTQREQDKRAAAQWARDLLSGEFIIFDTETTGFDDDDEIIQIGVIDHEGNTVLDQLIKPDQPILNSQYHGIADETVKDTPEFPDAFEQIKAALDGNRVIAFNYEYDSRMLVQECHKHSLNSPIQHTHGAENCAMEQYARFYGQWKSSKGSYTWKSLRDALFHFGLKHEDFGPKEHDACTDARATLALIKKMAEYEPEVSGVEPSS